MSFRHTLAVGLLPIRNPTLKAVLLALAHHAGEYTGRCWPSVDRLALFTGLGRRTVQQALRDAEKLQLVSIQARHGKPNVYDLTLPKTPAIDQLETGLKVGGAGDAPLLDPTRAADDMGGAGGAPEQSKESTRTSAHANDEINMEQWEPLPDTVEKVMKEERLSTQQVTEEARLFRLACIAGTTPARPDAAFRLWCARRKDLKNKSEPSGPRAPAPAADRRAEVLRLITNKRSLVDLYRRQGKDYEIEHQLEPEIARLEAELATLQENRAS